jgi:hypothetical protein
VFGVVGYVGMDKPYLDPQKEVDFKGLGVRVVYRPYFGVESLKYPKKRLICTLLVINEL